jgi:hypothetical protein
MSTDTDTSPLVQEISHLARTRMHRVSARQLAHPETMTVKSALALRDYLARQPERVPAPAAADIPAQVRHATAAAAAAISPYAKAGGKPASDEPRPASPAPARRVPAADRPQGDGYFLHEKRIYKVATSQYGQSKGHLFARKLDEQTGEWLPAPGMTSYLRETERITAEKAIEIGRKVQASLDPSMALYGKCWICKRVLTDETSIANGKGPGPHAGMDD